MSLGKRGAAMEATVTSKGQITLPKPIRDELGIRGGATSDLWWIAALRPEAQGVRRQRDRRSTRTGAVCHFLDRLSYRRNQS
jgi:bifunctional DNA-binding transcriptional regulator/antitoxin component of YhaV-PrlF toxin-antitoxin module